MFAAERLREYPVSKVCRVLNIPRSSLYDARRKVVRCKACKEDIYRAVIEAFREHHGSFGRRMLKKILGQKGIQISEYRIRKVMQTEGLCAKYGRRRCKNIHTSTATERYIHENVWAQLKPEERSELEVWSMDFTEEKIQRKKIYTCGIISVNRKILVGYAQSQRCTTELALAALQKAIQDYGKPDMIMTDRGSQFTSRAFFDILQENKITHSMSRPYKPIDNRFIETFWKSMKIEMGKLDLLTPETYRMVVDYYINYYNYLRPHSSLNYRPPLLA